MGLSAALAFVTGAARGAAAPARPNVLIILVDDMGYSDLGCYGGEIDTPNLDRLARRGLRFTQFYNTARCWPSRAALLTGYYPQQVNRDPAGVRPKWAVLLPELLKPAGYRSYHSGKWHVDGKVLDGGFARSYLVVDQDRHFGPKDHQLDDRKLPAPRPGEPYYATDAIASHAVDWLRDHQKVSKDAPFFLYLAFTSPHFPVQAPADDVAKYREHYRAGWDEVRRQRWERIRTMGLVPGGVSPLDPKAVPAWNLSESELRERVGPGEVAKAVPWDQLTPEQKQFQSEKMAVHAAMVDRIDLGVGTVLKQLEETGALENTLILFASDNGASAEQIIRGDGHDPAAPAGSAKSFLGIGPGWSTAANTPFRKHKSWTHEGGISTPLIVHWPAGIPGEGELRHAPGHLVDILPTLLDVVGLHAPPAANGQDRPALPGRSLVPLFANDSTAHPPLFFKHLEHKGLRVGDWKIVASDRSAWELYDLSRDRSETNDLAATHPEKVRELAGQWDRLNAEYANPAKTR